MGSPPVRMGTPPVPMGTPPAPMGPTHVPMGTPHGMYWAAVLPTLQLKGPRCAHGNAAPVPSPVPRGVTSEPNSRAPLPHCVTASLPGGVRPGLGC